MKRRALLALALVLMGCATGAPPPTLAGSMASENVTYYSGWTGYGALPRLTGPLPREEALQLRAYYVGHYRDGVLVAFEKFLDGKREWRDEYVYAADGRLEKRTSHRADGTVLYFDEKGRAVEPDGGP